jgi:hypothetical protein
MWLLLLLKTLLPSWQDLAFISQQFNTLLLLVQTVFLYRSGAHKICGPEHGVVARFRLKPDRRVALFSFETSAFPFFVLACIHSLQ